MGNADTKLAFRKAVVHLTTKTQVFSALLHHLGYQWFVMVVLPVVMSIMWSVICQQILWTGDTPRPPEQCNVTVSC